MRLKIMEEKKFISFRASIRTQQQIDILRDRMGESQTSILARAVDLLYAEEGYTIDDLPSDEKIALIRQLTGMKEELEDAPSYPDDIF